MHTAHSLLLLVRSWSHDHLTKVILGCNITFQPSYSELSGSCAQFPTKTLGMEPNRSKLRQGSSEEFWLLVKSGFGMDPCKNTNCIIFIEDIEYFQIR